MTSIKRRGAVEAQDLFGQIETWHGIAHTQQDGALWGGHCEVCKKSSSQTAVLVHKRNHISDPSCVEVGGVELVSKLNKTGTASRREGFACAEAKMDTSLLFGYTSHAF